MPYNGLATSDDVIREQGGSVGRVIRANLKGVSYTLAFHSEIRRASSPNMRRCLSRITKFDFDKMIPSVLPDGIADGEMQKTEIALRTELLGMPSDKITPSSSVFDFTVVAKAFGRESKPLPGSEGSQHGSRVAQHSANRDSYPLLRLKMKTDRNIWIMRAGTAFCFLEPGKPHNKQD